ncbi:MAG: hypothetical protein JXQ99_12315 [Hyphomicrobiaceae bacterium]
MFENLVALMMLVLPQAVLGFANLLSISIELMARCSCYFVIFVTVAVDIVQGRYQRRILAETEARETRTALHG